jgi:hypothetical protein
MGLVPVYRRTDRILRAWPVTPVEFNRTSFTLNGTDEYSNHDDILDKDGSSDFSLSGWLKTSSSSQLVVMGKQGDGTAYAGYHVEIESTGNSLRFELASDIGSTDYLRTTINTDYSWNADAWLHYVITYDGSKDESGVSMYGMGKLWAHTANQNTLTGSCTTSADLYLGGRASSGSLLPFSGGLDEIAVWSRALTPAEASAVYRARDLRMLWFADALQAYWSGDGGSGSVIVDYSGNGYHGTPVNMDSSNFTTDVHTPT